MAKMRLTENFYLYEFLRSQTAARHGIDMTPSDQVIGHLYDLCIWVLEPLRAALGDIAIIITSGYRPKELNNRIGGSKTSAHMDGRASDIIVPGISPFQVCTTIRDKLAKYDQNIHEFGQWTHVGIAYPGAIPRGEDLTTFRDLEGKTAYVWGIRQPEGLRNA